MADTRAKEWIDRAASAFDKLGPRMALYQALAEIFYPERATFYADNLVGDEYYRDIYDPYCIMMRWRLGNALGAMSRGKGREWFKAIAFPDHLNESEPVGAYLEDKTRTMRALIYDPRAQFADNMGLSDQDYALFGYSPLKITNNRDNTGVLVRTLHPKTLAPEENSEGVIDIGHEKPKLTARVLGQMFGQRGKLSAAMKKAIEKDPLSEIEIGQCVFPITEYEPSKSRPAPRGAKFVSLYLDLEKSDVIQEEYFFTFPYVCRRWMRSVSGSPLALSPCAMVAMADAHMSQDTRRTLIEMMEFAADPARMIVASAVEGNLDLAPGGDNFIRRGYDFRNGDPIRPVNTGGEPKFAHEFAKENREFQGQAWLSNLLTLPQDRTLTAYEAERILDQDAREAAPIFEPMESDNSTFMARVDDIGERWGAFLERPEELQRAESRYDFETPVSSALRRLRAQQAVQAIDFVGRLSQLELSAGQTQAYRRTNWKKIHSDGLRGIGPGDWLQDEMVAEQEIAGDETKKQITEAIGFGAAAQQLGGGMGPSGGPMALPAPQPAGAE